MELRDVWRLIEFEAHIHVVGHRLLEVGDGCLHGIDHRERGCIGAFGDGNVDGAAAVDMRIGGDQVGAVFDGGDIAQIDGGPAPGRIGVLRSSGRLPPRAALVRAMR